MTKISDRQRIPSAQEQWQGDCSIVDEEEVITSLINLDRKPAEHLGKLNLSAYIILYDQREVILFRWRGR